MKMIAKVMEYMKCKGVVAAMLAAALALFSASPAWADSANYIMYITADGTSGGTGMISTLGGTWYAMDSNGSLLYEGSGLAFNSSGEIRITSSAGKVTVYLKNASTSYNVTCNSTLMGSSSLSGSSGTYTFTLNGMYYNNGYLYVGAYKVTPSATYTITTAVSPSGAGTVSGGGSYVSGATTTLSATANSGYRFVNWSDGNTSSSRSVTVSANATYTANFQKYYTVTWNANGGTVTTASSNIDENSTVGDLQTPTRDGYEFAGWFTAATNGTQITSSQTVTANVTYFAQWNPVTDAAWAAEGYGVKVGSTYYTSLAEAVEKAADGDTITLVTNLTSAVTLTAAATANKDLTIDFNGYSADAALLIQNDTAGKSITLKNGTINGGLDGQDGAGSYAGGWVFENMTFSSSNALWNDAHPITIKSGTYPCEIPIPAGEVTIEGGTFSGEIHNKSIYTGNDTGTLVIKGGTFAAACFVAADLLDNSITLMGGTFATNPLTYSSAVTVADGYAVVYNGSTYQVLAESGAIAEGYIAKIGRNFYKTIAAANDAAADGDTIELLTNVVNTAELYITKAITIDGHDFEVSRSNANYRVYVDVSGKEVTFKNTAFDGGQVAYTGTTSGYGICVHAGTLTLTNSVVRNYYRSYSGTSASLYGNALWASTNSVLNLDAGTVVSNNNFTTSSTSSSDNLNIYGGVIWSGGVLNIRGAKIVDCTLSGSGYKTVVYGAAIRPNTTASSIVNLQSGEISGIKVVATSSSSSTPAIYANGKAINAYYATVYMTNGNFRVTGNTNQYADISPRAEHSDIHASDGKFYIAGDNIKIDGLSSTSMTNELEVVGNLGTNTSIGVYYPDTQIVGGQFGVTTANSGLTEDGASRFYCYTDSSYTGAISGTNLVWKHPWTSYYNGFSNYTGYFAVCDNDQTPANYSVYLVDLNLSSVSDVATWMNANYGTAAWTSAIKRTFTPSVYNTSNAGITVLLEGDNVSGSYIPYAIVVHNDDEKFDVLTTIGFSTGPSFCYYFNTTSMTGGTSTHTGWQEFARVAKIGDTYYEDLQTALNAVPAGD